MADGGMLFTVIPYRRELARQRLRQRDHAALRRRVVRHAAANPLRTRRRDRDDAAPLGGDHVGDRACTQWNVPVRFTSMHPVPRLERDLDERLEHRDAGAGDQDLDGPELAAHCADRRRRPRRGRRRRPGHASASSAASAQVVGDRLGRVSVHVEHGDAVAAAANCSQIERPIPEAPPVTTATRAACCSVMLVDAAVLHHEAHVLRRA